MGRKYLPGVAAHTVLVVVIGAVYFGLIAVGGPLGSARGLVAALVAGALFHPVRLRLQHLVDRLFKVERDPYKLADRVGETVQAAGGSAQALASGAVAIRQALRADGVAVEVDGVDPIADGALDGEVHETPLVWHGRPVGRLLVAGRRPDPALLDMLARHVAEVAHSVRLTEDLKASRERLLAAREEERARLLRVLDDGLGSTLAVLVGEVEGAGRAKDPDPVLSRVREQLTEAITSVRDLVYGLHPVLDEPTRARPPKPAPPPQPPAARLSPVTVIAWAGGVLSPLAVLAATWMAWRTDWSGGLQPIDPLGTLFPAAGAFLITYRPRLLVPWLLWSIGVAWAFYELVFCLAHYLHMVDPGHPLLPYIAWAAIWTWVWPVMAFGGVLPLVFPDGRLPSKWWRPVLYGVLILTVTHSVLMSLMPNPEKEIYLDIQNPFGVEALGGLPWFLETNIGFAMIPLCFASVVALTVRYWGADRVTKQQIAWYTATMVVYMGFWLGRQVIQQGVTGTADVLVAIHLLISAGVPIAVIAAVLRHRIYGIRVILNRTLVYGTLAGLLALVYAPLIWAGDLVAGDLGPTAGLVAALSVGAIFHPVRLRLQSSVDRLFGVERDPYKAADRLSRSVQEAEDPAEALGTATSMLRWAIGAKGAGVEVEGELFAEGELGHRPRSVELAWHGEPVGRLLLAGSRREPLAVMAKHLAELAHAVRLAADLRRSRERIGAAREEERRRLGRELHDGLGPALTSVTMTLDAARRSTDPQVTAELLGQVREGMSSTIVSVRELVDGLRPPSLDDLGLAGSLKVFAQAPGPAVEVMASGLGEIPADVELAAYRIVQEALTNVRKHAGARSALVRLALSQGELLVTVSDDGVGLPAVPDHGVGLTSMRERAAEVGGRFEVRRGAGGGTEVLARLPL
ncbi:histidine kinase [Nonomuraea sp. NPDC050556]|uniref:sensor histidine kinase n=1 Tax=Nonomuraea sp. NPDC050556 TaxID=3364369 RepID=UPI0037AEA179